MGGGQFVAAFQRQDDFLDGDGVEIGLGLEAVAHGECYGFRHAIHEHIQRQAKHSR